MVQGGGGARLALEAADDVGRGDQFLIDQFHGDRLAEPDVRRSVHRAHAALADEGLEPVLAFQPFPTWVAPDDSCSRTVPSSGQIRTVVPNDFPHCGQRVVCASGAMKPKC
jgi:hypothetical protein